VIGKIDGDGTLQIKRNGLYVDTVCMNDSGSGHYTKNCSHYCPFFGDPFLSFDGDGAKGVALDTCKRTLFFSELTDNRMEAGGK